MNTQSTHIADDLDLSMAPEPSSAVLARNLTVLRATDPELAERITAAPDRPLAIETAEDGHPTAEWQGRRLASARRPGEEAARILDGIDLRSAGLVAVAGFGLGQHVAALSRRCGKAGIVVVLEPDLELLRAVFSRIDASGWLATGNVRIVSEPSSSAIASRLRGLEPLIMVGIRLVEHPPSRPRLATVLSDFVAVVRDLATNARINLVTTLVRCAETLENQLGNLPAYASASGIEDLHDVAKGRLGVVVSAGPSLRRNMELLARPGVRDRCVIVATQTTLRPLLAAGIAPHFVTAIDYHAISRRFYDGITSEMVRDTELVVDSKVNPAVIDAWPGRVRTIPSTELDRVLGPLARGGTPLAPPATVAHLCYSLARHMGCDPVALIGQDLGFTDGLYYAPGNAIHDVWTPEFNAFNTVETMEWERIVRHRPILSAREDVHGRRMFTDVQMLTYLQTFEVMFADDARRGLVTIDATEGAVRKESTEIGTLSEALALHAGPDSEPIELPPACEPDEEVLSRTAEQVVSLLADVREIARASDEAASILGRMLGDQRDQRRMDAHFKSLDAVRQRVEARSEARALTDIVNQIGVYKRLRADRLISIERDLEPIERQRLELDRDVVNVEWTGEAARLLEDMLERSIEHVRTGRRRESGRSLADLERSAGLAAERGDVRRIFAVVPLDPDRGGTGVERRLDAPFAGGRLLDRVLQRLGRSKELTGIILLAPDDLEVESLYDREAVDLPIVVHRCGERVFPPAHDTVRSARASAPTSWRGGIQGLGVWDEVLAPAPTVQALAAVEGDAAILVGPDWPFIPVRGDHGIDATIRRWQDRPELPFVFTQAPPGLGAFLAQPQPGSGQFHVGAE